MPMMEAIVPKMVTTTRSSIKVNPRRLFLLRRRPCCCMRGERARVVPRGVELLRTGYRDELARARIFGVTDCRVAAERSKSLGVGEAPGLRRAVAAARARVGRSSECEPTPKHCRLLAHQCADFRTNTDNSP